MNVGRLFWATAAGATVLLRVQTASAHGGLPRSKQIIFSPSDPNLIVARTSFGILPSRDNGATWAYLCEDVFALPMNIDPEIGLTQNNALVAGVYSALAGASPSAIAGLDVSADLGCNWSCIGGPLAGQAIADVVVRPDTADAVLALTSTNARSADAGDGAAASTFESQVFQSTDDGAHWAELGLALDPAVLVQAIDVSKSDPHRIYVSGTRGFGSFRTASLFVSTNDGADWQEHPLTAFDPGNEYSLYIGAVDPRDPNRVYLRSSATPDGPGLSRVFVTTDGGQSFQLVKAFDIPPTPNGVVTNLSEILGFAISPDGSKIYAGSKEEGLFVANKSDLVFHRTSTIAVQCLATRKQELWACSDAKSGFIVGMSIDDGVTFTSKMKTVTSLTGAIACAPNPGGPLACRAIANGSQCKTSLETFCQSTSLTGVCEPDNGDSGTPSTGDGGGGHGPAASSCSCSTTGGGVTHGNGALTSVVAIVVRRRRERRQPRTSTEARH
jgi:hypothetical protein